MKRVDMAPEVLRAARRARHRRAAGAHHRCALARRGAGGAGGGRRPAPPRWPRAAPAARHRRLGARRPGGGRSKANVAPPPLPAPAQAEEVGGRRQMLPTREEVEEVRRARTRAEAAAGAGTPGGTPGGGAMPRPAAPGDAPPTPGGAAASPRLGPVEALFDALGRVPMLESKMRALHYRRARAHAAVQALHTHTHPTRQSRGGRLLPGAGRRMGREPAAPGGRAGPRPPS